MITFTAADHTTVTSFTGEGGVTFAAHPSQTTSSATIVGNHVRNLAAAFSLFMTSQTEASADGTRSVDLNVAGSGFGQMEAGLVARCDPSATTYYRLNYSTYYTPGIYLFKFVAGAYTQLWHVDRTLAPGTYNLALQLNGSTLTVRLDGAVLTSLTDTSIASAARSGLYLYGTSSDTTGLFLDNLDVAISAPPPPPPPPAPVVTMTVACFGNSLTAGSGSSSGHSYPEQLLSLLPSGTEIRNFGVPRQTTPEVTANVTSQIASIRRPGVPLVAVLWEITNDLYFNASATQAITNVANAIVQMKSAGATTIILVSALPRHDFPGTSTLPSPQQATHDSRRGTVNSALATSWSTDGADGWVNLEAADSRLSDPSDSMFADGVHLTDAGYAIVAAAVANVITNGTPVTIQTGVTAAQVLAALDNVTTLVKQYLGAHP